MVMVKLLKSVLRLQHSIILRTVGGEMDILFILLWLWRKLLCLASGTISDAIITQECFLDFKGRLDFMQHLLLKKTEKSHILVGKIFMSMFKVKESCGAYNPGNLENSLLKVHFPGINKILHNKTVTFITLVIKLLIWNIFWRVIAEMGKSSLIRSTQKGSYPCFYLRLSILPRSCNVFPSVQCSKGI